MEQQNKKQKPTSRPSVLSEEKIVDSDSDDQELQESTTDDFEPMEIKIVAGRKKRAASMKAQKRKVSVPKSNSAVESGEGESVVDEAGEEESENKDASSSSVIKRPAPTKASATPRKKGNPTLPTAIAPKAFKPPNGFEKAVFSASDYASDSTAFLTEDLSSKQVWHITAPASINIDDIKPFSIQDVRSGKPIFNKNGIDYGFLTGLDKTKRLLLASGESVEYAPAKALVSGTYHLRELGRSKAKSVANADKENDSIMFTAVSTLPPKKPREQPAGLRMRYQPYGSAPRSKEGNPPSSTPTFHLPPELPESQLEKSERKKQWKEEKTKEIETSHDADAMDIDPTPSSAIKNLSSRIPAKSAFEMAETTFEAATEPTVKEKKRRKKKHMLADEGNL